MNPSRLPSAGLAVTLLSGRDCEAAARVAEAMSGIPASTSPQEIDYPGRGSADFAAALADDIAAASRDGLTGNTVIVLDASADVVEVALMLEHVLDEQQPAVPVAIRDVVAVTSVHEVLATLFVTEAADSPAIGHFSVPGELARRLEFASLIVLTDVTARNAPAQTGLVSAFLRRLAPAAKIVTEEWIGTALPFSQVLARGRAHRLGASMGWQQQLAEGAPAAGTRDIVGTHVFRDPRPFHPERLHIALGEQLVPEIVGRILRSRGFVRFATRPDRVGSWSTAGDVLDLDPTSMLSWDPDSPIGQEIVFFGLVLVRTALDLTLSSCLLDPDELAAGPAAWAGYPDPFPEWGIHHHH